MHLIAHRGLVNQNFKENTISAFKAALDNDKYLGIELDVRVSKDKEFIIYHDLTYKNKLVKNISYKELKKAGIPKLEDVLKLNTDKIIMIEIKDADINLKKLANLLNTYNSKKLYVMSFNNKVLKDIIPYLKNIKGGSLNYVLNSEEDYSIFDFMCIVNYFLTEDLINYFKSQNIEVFAYGVKNKEAIHNKNIYYIVDDVILRK